MELYKTFFAPFDFTKLNFFNINDPVFNRASSIHKKREADDKFVAPICDKITLPKEYIKTKKITNGLNVITKSEAPAPEIIVVEIHYALL